MVFRLAPARGASKDGDDRNNNYSPRLSGRPASTASAATTLADEGDDDADDCCCCCRWFNRRGGRRSARVSPAGSAAPKARRAPPGGQPAQPAATPRGQVRAPPDGTLTPFEHFGDLLTLDSIDSNSETQVAQHVPPQKPVLARPAHSPPTQEYAGGAGAVQGAARGGVQSGGHQVLHPLAPFEAEETCPREDSASSTRTNNTSANNSATASGSGGASAGSTVSLHNASPSAPASGHASGGTSGYHSAAASPATRNARDAEALTSNGHHSDVPDFATSAGAGHAGDVDGESRPEVACSYSSSTPTSQDGAAGPPGPARFIVELDRPDAIDISPPPKRQSAAAARRAAAAARTGKGGRVPLTRPRAGTPGSLGHSLGSSAGSTALAGFAGFACSGSLSSSLGNSTASLFADTLPGFDNPREALNRCLQQLDSNEWEVTMQALQTVVRLVRHHPAIVQGQLHPCCEALARQVRNLRSQVARAACQAASHLFDALKRGVDAEAEDLSTALFNRTADTNKFLRADANIALDAMTDTITPAKAVLAIVHKGCRHQNAVVRAAGARLLARLVEKLGVERTMSQPRDTRDLLLLTSARLLMEGSLETRSYTKSLLKNLAQDHRLSSILVEIVPSNVMRSIDKTLKSCILRK